MRPWPRNLRGLALWMVLFIVAGVVIVISALLAAEGDVTVSIDVRGGSIPAFILVIVGAAIALGGVAGLRATRHRP